MIINWLLNLRKNKEKEVNEKAYVSGYDWAAGKLLRKEMTPSQVEAQCDTSSVFHEGAMMKAFDTGAQHAIDVLVDAGVVDEDRSFNLLCRADKKCPPPVARKSANVYHLFSEPNSPQ